MLASRRPWVFIASVLLLTLIALETRAQPEAEPPAEAETPLAGFKSRQDLGNGVTQAVLENGLNVLVRENHAAPVATVRSYVRNTGSVYEGEYLGSGISHLVEHLVSGGTTKNRTEDEIRAIVDSLGGQTNAFTSNDMTGYYVDAPAKKVDTAIELVADSMQHVTFPEEEYEREMGVVQRELEMGESERSRVAYQAMKSLVFTQHPMRHPIIGYQQVLADITREDVKDFYRDRYVPQNVVFVVAGDVETDHVLQEVQRAFADFRRTTERAPVLEDEPEQASPRSTRIEMPGETVDFGMAWPTVPLQHPDLYPLDVASYLLTHGDSSRLVKRLRIEQPLAISVDSASYTPGFVKGWSQVSIECQPENVEECRRIALEEIERLKQNPPDEQELAKVKRQKAAEHVFGQATVQAQAESLARSLMSTGDPLFDEQYVKGIQNVTAEEVSRVARKYFVPERLNVVTIAPPGSEAEAAKVAEAKVESDVLKKTLDNGLTVLVKRHAVLPMVNVQAFVRAGALSDPPQLSGRANLAAAMLEKGTEKYTGEEIAAYFDSIGGTLATDSQRNTSYVQATVLKDDFETAYDHVAQVLFHPTFPEDEFAKVRQLQLGQIAARAGNPQTKILDYWTGLLPPADPYSQLAAGSQQTVSKLTVEDLETFHERYFVPSNMVLAIFGDVDPEETLQLVEDTLGKLPAGEPPTEEYAESHQREKPIRETMEADLPGSAMVLLGFPTVSVHAVEDRTALDVMNGILTGGSGAGGRLFEELRGAQLVYYVFGFQMTGFAPGYQLFMAQTQPQTADEVVKRINAAVTEIAEEGVPADELEAVKEKLKAAHATSNTTPSSQAFNAALNELYGLGYDYDETYDERIDAVTAEDLKRVAASYLDVPIVVTTKPPTEE